MLDERIRTAKPYLGQLVAWSQKRSEPEQDKRVRAMSQPYIERYGHTLYRIVAITKIPEVLAGISRYQLTLATCGSRRQILMELDPRTEKIFEPIADSSLSRRKRRRLNRSRYLRINLCWFDLFEEKKAEAA